MVYVHRGQPLVCPVEATRVTSGCALMGDGATTACVHLQCAFRANHGFVIAAESTLAGRCGSRRASATSATCNSVGHWLRYVGLGRDQPNTGSPLVRRAEPSATSVATLLAAEVSALRTVPRAACY